MEGAGADQPPESVGGCTVQYCSARELFVRCVFVCLPFAVVMLRHVCPVAVVAVCFDFTAPCRRRLAIAICGVKGCATPQTSILRR